jgi:hypothetical protein
MAYFLCFLLSGLFKEEQSGARASSPANGKGGPQRFTSLPVETIFSTTFKIVTNIL